MFSESPCLYLKQPVDDVKPLRVTHHFWGGYHCPVSTELQHGFASIISHPVATSQQCSKPYCSAHWKKLTIMASDMCIHQSTYLSISSWFRFIAFHHPHIIPISSPYHPLNLHIEKFPCLAEKSSSTPFLIGFMWGGWQHVATLCSDPASFTALVPWPTPKKVTEKPGVSHRGVFLHLQLRQLLLQMRDHPKRLLSNVQRDGGSRQETPRGKEQELINNLRNDEKHFRTDNLRPISQRWGDNSEDRQPRGRCWEAHVDSSCLHRSTAREATKSNSFKPTSSAK